MKNNQIFKKGRADALLPDKEKVTTYINTLTEVPVSEVGEALLPTLNEFARQLGKTVKAVKESLHATRKALCPTIMEVIWDRRERTSRKMLAAGGFSLDQLDILSKIMVAFDVSNVAEAEVREFADYITKKYVE